MNYTIYHGTQDFMLLKNIQNIINKLGFNISDAELFNILNDKSLYSMGLANNYYANMTLLLLFLQLLFNKSSSKRKIAYEPCKPCEPCEESPEISIPLPTKGLETPLDENNPGHYKDFVKYDRLNRVNIIK